MDLALYRRFFAEEIETTSALTTPGLVDAFATIAREAFLPPGPWMLKGEADMGAAGRVTADADPRRVYHNVAVAIDAPRMLFNGQPAFIGRLIDQLALKPGECVLHVGCATGYYTAVMASVVGPSGQVIAFDVDAGLAAGARGNLARLPWVDVRAGNAMGPFSGQFDAVLVNAGVTHPLDTWIDALRDGGRIIVPLTVGMAGMGIGKGVVVRLTKSDGAVTAGLVGLTAIFSAVDLRDESLAPIIGRALQTNPMPRLKAFRRDQHDETPECWLHTPRFCLTASFVAQ
jgi:protein-L-isoaspartate(D-aspartate) O-methyltransferase